MDDPCLRRRIGRASPVLVEHGLRALGLSASETLFYEAHPHRPSFLRPNYPGLQVEEKLTTISSNGEKIHT